MAFDPTSSSCSPSPFASIPKDQECLSASPSIQQGRTSIQLAYGVSNLTVGNNQIQQPVVAAISSDSVDSVTYQNTKKALAPLSPLVNFFLISDFTHDAAKMLLDVHTMIQQKCPLRCTQRLTQFRGIFSNDLTNVQDDPILSKMTVLPQPLTHRLYDLIAHTMMFSDPKQLFSYIKQSAIIQFNAGQMFEYQMGTVRMVILRPGLYYNDATELKELFLLAIPNKKGTREHTWQLECVATYQQITAMCTNVVSGTPLPCNIRASIEEQLKICPTNIAFRDLNTWNFHKLTAKDVKMPQNLSCTSANCKKCGQFKMGKYFDGNSNDLSLHLCARCKCPASCHGLNMNTIGYLQLTWKMILDALQTQWASADFVPVVFNKGSPTIEWKVFIKVNKYSVVLSIRYNKNRRQWELQNVVDCEPHRLWSQYLLLGPQLAKGTIGGQERFWTEDDFKNRRKCIVKIVSKRK